MKSAQKKIRPKVRKSDNITAYAMLAPALILLSIFVVIPIIYAVYMSVYDMNFYSDSEFVGFRNYYLVLTDPLFLKSLGAGLKYVLYVVPAQFVLSFLMASALKNMRGKKASFSKVAIYVPTVVAGVVASCIFMFIYEYQGGIGNFLLKSLGMKPQAWYNSTSTAMLSIAIPGIWLGLGTMTLMMLAGMNDIPITYYEAAELDGANWWVKMVRITIPSLKNVFVYLLVTSFTSSMQVFELPFIITEGGPLGTTTTPNLLIFNHFRSDPYMGYTVAAAMVIFLILGSISLVIFRVVNSERAED